METMPMEMRVAIGKDSRMVAPTNSGFGLCHFLPPLFVWHTFANIADSVAPGGGRE